MIGGALRRRSAGVIVLAACIASSASDFVAGAESDGRATAPAASLRYRRVYAPFDQMDRWPRGETRYLPVDAEEFERLASIIEQASDDRLRASPARLEAAYYECRLTSDDTLIGSARIEVLHSGEAAAMAPLEPFGLALESAEWISEPPRPAIIGLNGERRTAVVVERSGALQFGWSLRGQLESNGVRLFSLALPRTPIGRLLIDVPVGKSVVAEGGVATRTEGGLGGFQRWRIDLATADLRIRLINENERASQRVALARYSRTYEFFLHGVDVSVDAALDIYHEPISRLELDLDAGLQLEDARLGTARLKWSSTTDPDTDRARVSIEFPTPLSGAGHHLRLRAVCPLTMTKRWRIPSIKVANAVWQEGGATLVVPAPLSLDALFLTSCRQTEVERLTPPRVGDSFTLQEFAPDAAVEVVIARRQPQLALVSGTTIEIDGRSVVSRVVARLSARQEEVFVIEADVARGWLIDSLEANPPDAIVDWEVERRRNSPDVLVVHLKRALKAEQPLELVAAGRRGLAAPDQPLKGMDFSPLDFRGMTSERRIVSVRPMGSNQLSLAGADELFRLDRGALSSSDDAMFSTAEHEMLFLFDRRADLLEVSLNQRRPRYRGAVHIDVDLDPKLCRESYTIRCLPEGAPVERVVVWFSAEDASPLHWTMDENGPPLAVRQWTESEQSSAGLSSDGAAWEVSLDQPRSGPFVLHAMRLTEFSGGHAVRLAMLPQAESQQGRVRVTAPADAPIDIIARGPTPIPAVSTDARQPAIRGEFNYEIENDLVERVEPALEIRRLAASETAAAVVWKRSTVSRYDVTGAARHQLQLDVQNDGRDQLTIDLPPDVVMHATTVDGLRIDAPVNGRRQNVPLPVDSQWVTIRIQFESKESRFGWLNDMSEPHVVIDAPVLESEWFVAAPPGYKTALAGDSWWSRSASRIGLSERLFGPFAREQDRRPFDPTSRTDWERITGAATEDDVLRVEQVTEALNAAAAPAREGVSGLTWGRIVDTASTRLDGADIRLLVHGSALRERGVTPFTLIQQAHGRSIPLLAQAELSLFVNADVVVISTAAFAAESQGDLQQLPGDVDAFSAHGDLAKKIRSETEDEPRTFLSAAAWLGDESAPWSASPMSPWSRRPTTGQFGVDQLRSSAIHRIPYAATSSRSVTMVRGDAWMLLSCLSLIIAAAASLWCIGRRPSMLIVIAATSASVAFLAPPLYAPFGSGALLGALLAILLTAVAPLVSRGVEVRPAKSRSETGGAALTTTALLAILALATTIAAARGDESDSVAQLNAGSTANVFIPVDAEQHPTGARYLVPEHLFSAMRAQADREAAAARGWVITSAEYRLSAVADASDEQQDAWAVRAAYTLYLFGSDTEVFVPLSRDRTPIVLDECTLDGRSVEAVWDAAGESIRVMAAEPGEHRLECLFLPRTVVQGDDVELVMEIPPVANSTLTFDAPPNPAEFTFPSARGVVQNGANARRLTVDLGPTPRLAVRWSAPRPAAVAAPDVAVDELLWLQARPGSVVIDARFTFNVQSGSMNRVRFEVDPRLRLLPMETVGSPVERIRTNAGQPSIVEMDLVEPASDRVTIHTQWLATGASGVGAVRLPRIEVLDARSSRRWLGVSLNQGLVHQAAEVQEEDLAVDETISTISPAEFAAAWSESPSSTPLVAYSIPRDASQWSISVRPNQPATEAVQSTVLSFERRRLRITLDATIVTTDGATFQYRIAAPADLAVESISVREDEAERAARWARDGDGLITVFLTSPASGPQTLSLVATMPTPTSAAMPLPYIHLQTDRLLSSQLHLFRRPEVRVLVGDALDVEDLADTPTDIATPALARRVASFKVTGREPSATLHVSRNQPQVDASLATTVQHDGLGWHAELNSRFRVRDGVLDTLRFDVPSQWVGPYVLTPSTPHQLATSSDGSRRLVIRPNQPIENEYRLKIRGPLTSQPAGGIEAPDVALRSVAEMDRFVLLPARHELNKLTWMTRGLTRAAPPASVFSDEPDSSTYHAYRVSDRDFQATLRSTETVVVKPRVRIADIYLACRGDGGYVGVACFDVDPGGHRRLPLYLSGEGRLVRISIGGRVATAIPAETNRWDIAVDSDKLPQRIEVVFMGRADEPSWKLQHVDLPRLGDVPVDLTLISVLGSSDVRTEFASPLRRVSSVEQQLIRLRSTAQTIEVTAAALGVGETAPSEPAVAVNRWYATWIERLFVAEGAVHGALAERRPGGDQPPELEEVQSIHRRQGELAAEVFQLKERFDAMAARPPIAASPSMLWEQLLAADLPVVRLAAQGGVGEVAVVKRSTGLLDLAVRLTIAATLLISAMVIMVRKPAWDLTPWRRRWPQAIGVGVGLIWWFWLWPSVLGLLIIVLSMATFAWPRRRTRFVVQ